MSFLPTLGSASELIRFPSCVRGHLAGNEETPLLIRGHLPSNEVALLYKGSSLEVVNLRNDERLSARTFADEITAIDSLGPDQIVIGLGSGKISVFDVKISKVIKSLSLPGRISCLCAIHASSSRSFAEELMFFRGILAVGTQGGRVYLVDLGLDAEGDEMEVSSPIYISPGVTAGLADIRQGGKNHLCISLNEEEVEDDTLVVSAVSYIPQLGSLVVGFNSGSWKLWNLNRLEPEFSSPTSSASLPCVGFAFQEPENDPRNYSYLWVMRSENDIDSESDKSALRSFATIQLYALCYENRDEVDQYGVLYSGLKSCLKRFEHSLSGDPEGSYKPVGSLGLTAKTFGSLSNARQAQLDISEPENDFIYTQGLCIFLWEVRLQNEINSQYFLGVFDLNMWYQDQMPTRISVDHGDICSFLSFCSMEDTLLSCPSASILDVFVDISSLSRCKSFLNSEKHFYSSSLTFELVAVLDKGFVHASHLGLQRKVLLELQSEGHSSLVEPNHLYSLCCVAGLITELNLDEKVDQRYALLTVALEHNLVNLLTGCVSYWSDGKYSEEGCTMKALLDWAWQRVAVIKQTIDKVTISLFDLSSFNFDEGSQKALLQNSQQLHHLCAVIQELIRQSTIVSQMGQEELHVKMNVARLVNLYVRVVLWFFSAGLLPELPEPHFGKMPLQGQDSPYPYTELSSAYKSKRRRLLSLHKQWEFSDVPPLLIDGLCKQFGTKLSINFERDGGDGHYPPPTLRSLLCSYLIDDHGLSNINDICKHRLVHYLFLDMADKRCNDEMWSDMIDRLIQFPSAFSVPPSIIKLTQAFWLLDQGDFEEAMTMLLDPLILDKDIDIWEHRAIIVSFLVQEQAKLALKYSRIRHPPTRDAVDVKLHVSILLSTGNIHEAFQFLRNRQRTCKDLLLHFFLQAEKLGKLNLLFELTLSTYEEKEFISFLQNSESSSEVLLMYYLQRYRFQEAMSYHRLLKQRNMSTPTHQAIMDRYSNLLPNLLYDAKGYDSLKVTKGTKFPVPLSVEIKTTNFNPLFHTSVIEEKLKASLEESSLAVFTPFRPRGQRRAVSAQKRRFTEVDRSNSIDEGELVVQPPSSKKSRFIDTRYFQDGRSPIGQKSLSTAISSEVVSILSTPTIVRKKPVLPNKFCLDIDEEKECLRTTVFDEDSPFSKTTSPTAPPSILKIRQLDSGSPTATYELRRRETTPTKSLRFDVPKKLPPPSLVPVDVISEEEGNNEKDLSRDKEVMDVPSSASSSSSSVTISPVKKREETPSMSTHRVITPRKPLTAYSEDEGLTYVSSAKSPKLPEELARRITRQLEELDRSDAVSIENNSPITKSVEDPDEMSSESEKSSRAEEIDLASSSCPEDEDSDDALIKEEAIANSADLLTPAKDRVIPKVTLYLDESEDDEECVEAVEQPKVVSPSQSDWIKEKAWIDSAKLSYTPKPRAPISSIEKAPDIPFSSEDLDKEKAIIKSVDEEEFIKTVAEKDAYSFKTPMKKELSPFKSENTESTFSYATSKIAKSSNKFQFTIKEEDTDSDLLSDNEDDVSDFYCDSEDKKSCGTPEDKEPKLYFSQPKVIEDQDDKDITFNFSAAHLVSQLDSEASSYADELNTNFQFSSNLTVIESEEDEEKECKFAFSQPKQCSTSAKKLDPIATEVDDKTLHSSQSNDDKKGASYSKTPSPLRKRISFSPSYDLSHYSKTMNEDKQSEDESASLANVKEGETTSKTRRVSTPFLKDSLRSRVEAHPTISTVTTTTMTTKRVLRSSAGSFPVAEEISKEHSAVNKQKIANEELAKSKRDSKAVINISKSDENKSLSKTKEVDEDCNTILDHNNKSVTLKIEPTKTEIVESKSKPSPKKLKVNETSELSVRETKKSSPKALPAPHRIRSSASVDREISQPRRSKRLSYSSVQPPTSEPRQTRSTRSADREIIKKRIPTPSRKTPEPRLKEISEEKEREHQSPEVLTPLRKSKRLSVKSQTYEEPKKSLKKKSVTTSIEEKIEEKNDETLSVIEEEESTKEASVMYLKEEPFGETKSAENEEKSDDNSPRETRSARKRYVAKKKVTSKKIFF